MIIRPSRPHGGPERFDICLTCDDFYIYIHVSVFLNECVSDINMCVVSPGSCRCHFPPVHRSRPPCCCTAYWPDQDILKHNRKLKHRLCEMFFFFMTSVRKSSLSHPPIHPSLLPGCPLFLTLYLPPLFPLCLLSLCVIT